MAAGKVSPTKSDGGKDVEANNTRHDDWEQLSAANAVYIAGELRAARKPAKPGVKLLHVLEDFYDYRGLTEVGWIFVQFVLATLILQFHWSERNSGYKSKLISQLQRYGELDYQMLELGKVDSMKETADYMVGFMQTSIDLSQARQLPPTAIFTGEYGNFTAGRIIVNVDANCLYGGLQCFRETGAGPLNASHWQPLSAERFQQTWCQGECKFYASQIWQPATTRSEANASLAALAADIPYLGKYAAFLSMEFLTNNELDQSIIQHVSLTALRTIGTGTTQLSPKETLQMLLETTVMRTSYYTNSRDWVRLGLEVTFLILVAISIRDEVNQWWLCVLHAHYHGVDPRRKWYDGTVKYITNVWNVIDIMSHIGTVGLAISYAVFIYQLWHLRDRGATTLWPGKHDADALLALSYQFKIWLYIALGHNTLIGLRMFQFLMAHGGLRIYYNMFIFGSKLIADFIIFFAYVFFVIGLAIAAFFQISGGNPLFTTSNDAIQTMALMTFGFLDYSTFYNNGWGATPDQQRLVQFLFWLTVILWIVVCQNLIIAIVLEAWKQAIDYQEQSLPTTASFFKIVIYRLLWQAWCYLSMFLSMFHLSLSAIREDLSFIAFRMAKIRAFLTEVAIEVKDDPEWKAAEEINKVFNRMSGFYARWAVASMMEAESLLELFSDPSLHRIYVVAVWLEEDFQYKVDALYNNQLAGQHAQLLMDFDIHRPLTRMELRAFLKLVGDTTLLKAKGLVASTRLFGWKDVGDLEDWIWKVYCRDFADEGEETEAEAEAEESAAAAGAAGPEPDDDADSLAAAAQRLLKKTGAFNAVAAHDDDADSLTNAAVVKPGAASPPKVMNRSKSEPGSINVRVSKGSKGSYAVQFGEMPQGKGGRPRSGHTTGFTSPTGESQREAHPMYDLLKRVAELDSIKTVQGNPLANKPGRARGPVRPQDVPGALSLPGGVTSQLSKQTSDGQTEGLLHVALMSQKDLRQNLKKMEAKLGALLQMHQALLRNQQRLKEYMDEVVELVADARDQAGDSMEGENVPLRRGDDVSFRST